MATKKKRQQRKVREVKRKRSAVAKVARSRLTLGGSFIHNTAGDPKKFPVTEARKRAMNYATKTGRGSSAEASDGSTPAFDSAVKLIESMGVDKFREESIKWDTASADSE